jgi:potassium efflux system protein
VLFDNFGESALTFGVYFWIRIADNHQRKKVESDLRFEIDELFKQAGIVIAFSQSDIHLDTHKPLELKMITDEGDTQQ